MDVYVEEKMEDEEDMKERTALPQPQPEERGHHRRPSESEEAVAGLVSLAKKHGELYPVMLETMKRYANILERDVPLWVVRSAPASSLRLTLLYSQLKADLFTVLDKFVENAAMLDNLYASHMSIVPISAHDRIQGR
jgi:diaphanous 1